MQNRIILLSLIAIQLLPSILNGQILYTRNDSTSIEKDTLVKLSVLKHRGEIQWQKSPDGTLWINLSGGTRDTIAADRYSEAVYRAKITEGTCLPLFSDSAYIFIRDTVSGNSLQSGSLGLTLISDSLQLANGKYIYTGLSTNNFEIGSVIIDEVTGRIRKITGITLKGDTIFTETEPATMEDLFLDASFKLSTAMVTPAKNLKSANLAEIEEALTDKGGYIHPVEVILYDQQGNKLKSASVFTALNSAEAGTLYAHREWSNFDIYNLSGTFSLPDKQGNNVQYTGNVKSTISEGYLTFDPEFKLEFEFNRPSMNWHHLKANKGEITRFKVYTDHSLLDVRNILAFDSDIGYQCLKNWILVPGIIHAKFKFIVNRTPIWINVKVDIHCGLSLGIGGKLVTSQGFQNTDSVTIGADYEAQQWSTIKNLEKTNQVFASNSGLGNAGILYEIYPSVELRIYDIIGPEFKVGPDFTYESVLSSSDNWNKKIDLGVDAQVGVQVAAIGKEMIPFPSTEWNFFHENLWKSPVTLSIVSGDNQTGPSDIPLPAPIILKVLDSGGQSVQNVQVHFSPMSGFVPSSTVKTDVNGTAQTTWTLANTPGEQNMKVYLSDGRDIEIQGSSLTIKANAVSTNLPAVTTTVISAYTQTTATGGGTVTSDGGVIVSARGVCWSTTQSPTIADSKTTNGSGTGTFASSLTGLTAGTLYYVRAYATNSAGTAYGNQVSFTTQAAVTLPTVSTATISVFTQTTATGGGTVSSDGGAAVIARGVCWNTTGTPTITDTKTTDGSGTGSFISSLNGLTAATTYYVRAWATNSQGTAYGNQVSFTTSPVLSLPTVITNSITNITQTTATGGGNVTSDGNASVTARGVCWNTTGTPTITDTKTTDGSGTGTFASSLSGLSACTIYYVRAYATNSAGTIYGSQASFTTTGTASLPTVTTAAVSVFSFTNATCGGNITGDGGATVIARGVCYNTTGSPVITDNKTVDGSGTGLFTSTITGLNYGTRYYVRSYATNCAGTAYGDEKTFLTWNEVGTFTDARDGHEYIWVKISGQVWMHDNLAWLPFVYPIPVASGSYTAARYYVYGYDGSDVSAAKATTNYTTYGALYNWPAALAACPSGWHLPSDEEWKTLEKNLGMTVAEADVTGSRTSGNVGMQLKSTTGWASSGNGWNTSGFKALPAGIWGYWGEFVYQTTTAAFWTNNEANVDQSWFRGLYSGSTGVSRVYTQKSGGLSVRCLKD